MSGSGPTAATGGASGRPRSSGDTGSDADAVVVGAGIAGLGAACELAAAGLRPRVVDAGSRPGGVMQTDAVRGYRVETGPNTFQAKAPFCAFATRHALWEELICAAPESRKRWIWRGDELLELPHGPLSALATPLVSPRAKARILAEPLVRRGDPTGETVDAFVSRRLGAEASRELVGAFLTGVYAGDERTLGAEAVFPGLVEWERTRGSIVRGALRQALSRRGDEAGEPARRGTWSAREGLGSVADRLASRLPDPPRLETRVVELVRDDEVWRVATSGPDGEATVRTRRLVVATPAFEAARLLSAVDPELAELATGVEYAPIVAVALGADPAAVRTPIDGFGFLVPRSARARLLGCLFISRLFPDRAPAGRELLHCMLGGTRWPEAVDLPEEKLMEPLLDDLERSLGLRAAPETLCVRRWPRAIPQPGPEHTRRMAALQGRIAAHAGLALAGSYLAGVSVADTLESGVQAAGRVTAGR